ncbi:MAG: PDZ domain-containing protein [Planctomycetes bacterium]|nr:PDZ domain-containing protein [Planctomycetota bacterium]
MTASASPFLVALAGLGGLLSAQIVPPLPKIPLGKAPTTEPQPGPGPTPYPAPAAATAEGGVGIAFQSDTGGNLVVAQLAPGGAADRARVPVGSVLRAVDGRKVAGMSMEQVRALCIGKVGSLVTLTLETDREVLDVVLERRPLQANNAAPNNRDGGGGGEAPAGNGGGPGAFAGCPDWLRSGARVTYYSGQATLPGVSTQLIPDDSGYGWKDQNGRTYREEQVQGSGGGGYTQYDFVQVAPDCIAAMQSTHVFADANLQTTTLASAQAVVGDQNGLTDLWVPPARLRTLAEQDQGGLRVRRLKYALEGRTYDAVVQQVKGDSGWTRYTYDAATGLLLVYSASSTGGAVLTRDGSTLRQGAGGTTITSVVLRSVRQIALPWTGQAAAPVLQPGRTLEYSGVSKNSLAEGVTAPWRYGVAVAIEKRTGDCVFARLTTRLEYGYGMQPQEGSGNLVYGPGSFAPLAIDPRALQKLRPGQVFDRDPVTGRQLSFVGSDGRTATIAEQGPLDQQNYTYDLQSGTLVAFAQRQQQGPAVITQEVQLQQR